MGIYDRPKWKKKLLSMRFDKPIPCPYNCGETLSTSLLLARHVLQRHNFYNPEQKVS